MRYWIRTVLGLGLALAALVAVNWAIYELLRRGSCAVGGPYAVANTCADGTGLRVLTLAGSPWLGLLGAVVYATRGDRGVPSRADLTVVLWSLGMCTLALSCLVAAFGPASLDLADAKTGAVIVAAVLLPLGLAPLPILFRLRTQTHSNPRRHR
jgi:hypothetical protein